MLDCWYLCIHQTTHCNCDRLVHSGNRYRLMAKWICTYYSRHCKANWKQSHAQRTKSYTKWFHQTTVIRLHEHRNAHTQLYHFRLTVNLFVDIFFSAANEANTNLCVGEEKKMIVLTWWIVQNLNFLWNNSFVFRP